jgi:hypothetical protein
LVLLPKIKQCSLTIEDGIDRLMYVPHILDIVAYERGERNAQGVVGET